MFDELATDYINGMFESQYDEHNENGDKGYYIDKTRDNYSNTNEVDNNEIPW